MLDSAAIETIRDYKAEVEALGTRDALFHVSAKGAVALKHPSRKKASVFSLTQLVNYIRVLIAGPDIDMGVVVNVCDHQTVEVISDPVDDNQDVEIAVETDFSKVFTSFPFEKQLSQEEFIINLMTKFEDTDQRTELIQLASSVRAEKISTNDDDGFSQEVATKAGVHLTKKFSVKNLWMLKTYKTFPEVEQPIIPYILRLHQREEESPKYALYECDGGKWKVDTTIAIREWIKNRVNLELGESAGKVSVL